MTKYLGRIAQLKIAIDTLNVIDHAVEVIQKETGENYFLNPENVMKKANEKLTLLKKSN